MNHLCSLQILTSTGPPPLFSRERRTLRLARPKGHILKDLYAHPVVTGQSRWVRNLPR